MTKTKILTMTKRMVKTMTNIVYIPCHRHQGLSVDPWVARLVESLDLHLEPRVLSGQESESD